MKISVTDVTAIHSNADGAFPPQAPVPNQGGESPVNLALGRLVVEGLGPISVHALRDGFKEGWLSGQSSLRAWATERDTTRSDFSKPLDLTVSSSNDARSIGRQIAESIVRAAAATQFPSRQPPVQRGKP